MESDLFDFVLWCLKTKGSEAFSKQKQNYHTILWSKWCLSGYTVQSSLPLPRLGCLRLRCAASITGSKSLNQYQALCCEVLKLILLFVNICFCGASKQFGTKSWWISSSCQLTVTGPCECGAVNVYWVDVSIWWLWTDVPGNGEKDFKIFQSC